MGYSFLEPIKVGPHTLRNRITKSAMAEYICAGDGTVSDQYVEFYRTIAAGGTALVVPGIIPLVEPQDPPIFMGNKNPSMATDACIPEFKKVVDAVHGEGSLIMFQIWHSGCYQTPEGLKSMVDDFTTEQLRELEGRFFDAAVRCKKAGADGVEFHMAHTYLASQLLSPLFNHRTDEYGSDTIENSCRFATNVISRITRELCDDAFTVIVKLQGSDCKEDGITPARAAEAAKLLEAAGAQMFTVNAGGALVGYQYMSDNGHRPEGWKVDYAAEVKRAVSVPVATCGNIRHPDYMHELVRDGKTDIVAFGRELYADPEFVHKCEQGREDEINASYGFKLDDGRAVYIHVEGIRAVPDELVETVKAGGAIDPKQFYYVTTPTFEVYDESLKWMTKKIFVCDAVRLPDAVLLTYYTVEQVNDHPALG